MNSVDAVIQNWINDGVVLNPGATSDELDELSKILGIPLPDDVRAFYAAANGMPDCTYDSHMVEFWSIAKIRQQLAAWDDEEIGFADVLINSWRFIFRISKNRVIVVSENVAPGDPKEEIGSFTEFLELYSRDTYRLKIL